MSIDTTLGPITDPELATTPSNAGHRVSWSDSFTKSQKAIRALSSIITSVPPTLFSDKDPAVSLLHDAETAAHVSSLLRQPNSGAGDNNLCRWLYDTFQSSDPGLQLVVLRFLPIIAGVYLPRVALRKPLAGFEAVFLALYAHEASSRNGQSVTVSIPDISHPSIYHETKQDAKNSSTDLHLAVISPGLEPHGTVRSTRRARIVGIALELYYKKIFQMPEGSKIDFCEFCQVWSGHDGSMYIDGNDTCNNIGQLCDDDESALKIEEREEGRMEDDQEGKEKDNQKEKQEKQKDQNEKEETNINEKKQKEEKAIANEEEKKKEEKAIANEEEKKQEETSANEEGKKGEEKASEEVKKREVKEGRIGLPWELLQPVLRILGHCLMGPTGSKELQAAALAACRSLYARCLHDINPKAILATGSLLRLEKIALDSEEDPDPTEMTLSNVITL